MIALLVWMYSGRNSSSEVRAIVSKSPVTSSIGEVSVDALSLPNGGRYHNLHCADTISREQCAELSVGMIITIRNTVNEYGTETTSEIVRIGS